MRFSFALFFLAASPLFASYSSFINDNLTTINTTTWAQNGTLAAGSSGLTSSSSTGGSLIYKGSALSGKQEYEVRTTYHLTQSGGTFITYLEATQNAQYGTSTGTYYALALINPTFSGGTCTAGLSLYRGGSSPATLFSYPSVSCYDGMIIRLVYGNSNQMIVYFGVYTGVQSADHSGYSAWAQDSTLGAAAPGIGVINSPAGNTISNVQVFQPDLTAPGTVNAQSIGTSVFSNHVDFQWQGVTDDTNGSGLAFYQIARNGTTFYDAADAEFSDATVSPSTTYSYTIYASDFYLNSSSTTVSVVTPPTGDIDPREVGVRRQGAYWGGGGEQIDMRSGNVNYTLPVVTMMGRAGLGISLALTNNSQNWRQDPAGIWQMGRDVGYGYGWKLQAGALLPVWNTSYSVDHYLFIDGSGAEYRLDQTTGNGVWTSKQGIYLSLNAGGQNLYFPDGSHWNFGCISAGTEDDAGTMYPTLIEDRNGNQITLAYAAGRGGVTWTNSSGRITQVGDSVGMNAYVFNYNTDSIPHLTGILDYRSGSGQFTFAYNSLALTAPFTPATGYGTWSVLASATQSNSGRTWSFGYDSSGSGEIAQATMPEGGSLGWVYGPSTYYGSRTQREAQTRNLVMSAGATPLAYTIYHYMGSRPIRCMAA